MPGQGLSLLLINLRQHLESVLLCAWSLLLHISAVQRFNVAVSWFLVSPLGFGGRGVLPGVPMGTDLNQKSSNMSFFPDVHIQVVHGGTLQSRHHLIVNIYNILIDNITYNLKVQCVEFSKIQ